ncbi:MAG: hypothetical protein HFE86_06055 [Clostridiales bacterium]|nr:hypothetical protein [Clostridiales bacterium]
MIQNVLNKYCVGSDDSAAGIGTGGRLRRSLHGSGKTAAKEAKAVKKDVFQPKDILF